VLVNDVGAVNVDAALIADHDGTTLSLTNGCVCCAIADDFTQTLEQVRDMRRRPDHVLMELSGVAEPARVAPWADTSGFQLDGIVVAVDIEQIVGLVDHPYVADTIRAQLSSADVLVLTKNDLGDARRAAGVVARYSDAPAVIVEHGSVDVDVLLGVHRSGPIESVVMVGSHHDVEVVRTVGLTRDALEATLDAFASEVVRVKGLVMLDDVDAPVEVQVVGRRRRVTPRPDLDVSLATDVLVVISARPPTHSAG